MKKMKIFPMVLMLVLCVAAFGMGVFAAGSTQHTIGGQIQVVGSSYPVKVDAWIDSVPVAERGEVQTTGVVKANTTDVLEFNNLQMNMKTANSIYDASIVIAVRVTNLSNKELGAFFLNPDPAAPEIDPNEGATRENLYPTSTIKDPDTNKDIIDVDLTFYKQIGVKSNDESVITDEATLYIQFTPKDFIYKDYGALEFNYTLMIEEYKPNMTTERVDSENALDFYKVSSSYEQGGSTIARTSAGHLGFGECNEHEVWATPRITGGYYVVLPNGITTTGDGYWDWDGGSDGSFIYSGVKLVSFPNSLTTIGFCSFLESDLSRIELTGSITTIGGTSNGKVNLSTGGHLKSVYVASENTKYYSQGNCIIETGTSASYGGEYKKVIVGGANAEIPSDITVIGACAFYLSSLNLNLKVNCPNLKYIEQMSFGAFGSTGNTSNLELYIPDGCSVDGVFVAFWNGSTINGKKITFEGTADGYWGYDGGQVFEIVEFLAETPDFTNDCMDTMYQVMLPEATTIYVPKGAGTAYKNVFNDALDAKVVER